MVDHRSAFTTELTRSTLIRVYRGLEIHVVRGDDAPETLQEIGTIRECEFRAEGGGSGKEVDIDEYDIGAGGQPFYQLVVLDREHQEIVSMYRFLPGWIATKASDIESILPTARLFHFGKRFVTNVLPRSIELGRSVVNRQSKKRIHGLFASWAGLGALLAEFQRDGFFFGKVTTYPNLAPSEGLESLHEMWERFFPGDRTLIRPKPRFDVHIDNRVERIPTLHPRDAVKWVAAQWHSLGAALPSLILSYTGLSSELQSFGTARNPHFGDVWETAILLSFLSIDPKRIQTFVSGYERVSGGFFDTVSLLP